MSPFNRAGEVYDHEPCARSFVLDVTLHLRGGYVFSTPEYFIMGRGVDSTADIELILNPEFIFPRVAQDAWWVYLCAGDGLGELVRLMPYPLAFVGWERGNIPRFYRLDSVLSRIVRPKIV